MTILLSPFELKTALIVLDEQKAMDDPRWNAKNDPGYGDVIA